MVDCHHNLPDYTGPERRTVPDRRADECLLHSGLQQSYDDLKELQGQACRAIGRIEKALETKVPMKLFYVMIGLVVAILGFQWTTYERVNSTALLNQQQSSEIKLEIQKISSNVDNHQLVNKIELGEIRGAIKRHQTATDKEIETIDKNIREIKKSVNKN